MKSTPALPIAQALRLLREREGLSQTEVGRRTDGQPDFRTISYWETSRKYPSLRLLLRYLEALDLDLHDLQIALDHVAERPDRLTSRFTQIERRLKELERWRLEATHAAPDEGPEGSRDTKRRQRS